MSKSKSTAKRLRRMDEDEEQPEKGGLEAQEVPKKKRQKRE